MSFQTDNAISPASSPEPQTTKVSKGLACIFCQQRKVKCDRKRPCASCTKARVTCTYRARQAPRRRHTKATEVSLRARLGRLEELLKTAVARNEQTELEDPIDSAERVSSQSTEDVDSIPSQLQNRLNLVENPEPSSLSTAAGSHVIPGQLISDHGKSRYIENKLWNKIYEELKDTQEILEEESSDEETPSIPVVDLSVDPTSADLTLGASTSSSNLRALHPHPSLVPSLWTAFVENVNPLTKIVHAPTTKKLVYEASYNLELITREVNALLFAIYFAAVTSMAEQECTTILGEPKPMLFSRYKYATQKALLSANYLKSSDVTVLQAFILYLLAARPYYDARSFWAISGIAIRIAQRMGIHKDGSAFGMTPFQSEMRRRLWWQIVFIEIRAAEVAGVGLMMMTAVDIKAPLNVNDDDLYPDMLEPPVESEGTTDMCFVRLRSSIGQYFKYLYRPQYSSETELGQSFFAPTRSLEEMMKEFEDHLHENFLKNADPLNPLQFFTSMAARAILCGWKVMGCIRQAAESNQNDQQELRDTLFRESLKGIEYHNLSHTTKSIQRFLWHVKSHFQWHSLIALLGELRARTEGELVERAWQQIGEIFTHHSEILKTKNPLHTAVGNLTIATWEVRESDFARKFQLPLPPPEYVVTLRRQRLARGRSIDKSNFESPAGLSSISPSNINSEPQVYNTDFSSMSTEPTFNMPGRIDLSSDFTSSMHLDSNQMDWNVWDSLLQNYELAATSTESSDFLMPKEGTFGFS